jgi:hypothetical protein
MPDFQLTPEQDAVLAEAKSPDSLLIKALAGSAKTTTLVLLAKKLPLVPTLSCAFNKRIADEMAKRMPSHVESRTMNSIGHGVWGKTLGRRCEVVPDKCYNALSELMQTQPPEQRKVLGEAFASVLPRPTATCPSP